jgi:hypothetical protein
MVFLLDEVCKKSMFSEKTYVCKILNDCKTAIQDIRDNVKYPTICSFKGKMPVVCCAPESVTRAERLEKEKETDLPKIEPGITREYFPVHFTGSSQIQRYIIFNYLSLFDGQFKTISLEVIGKFFY